MRGFLQGSLEEQLDEFRAIAEKRGKIGWNLWLIDAQDREIYLRYYYKPLQQNPGWCLEISNMTFPEEMRGQGTFTRFLEYAEQQYPWIMIENIHNPRLHAFVKRRAGYTPVEAYRIDGEGLTFERRTA